MLGLSPFLGYYSYNLPSLDLSPYLLYFGSFSKILHNLQTLAKSRDEKYSTGLIQDTIQDISILYYQYTSTAKSMCF